MEYAFSERRYKLYFILWFLLGIILGTAVFNCLSINAKTDILIYGKYLSKKIEVNNVNKMDLFIYVLQYRFKELSIFIILGMTNFKKFFHAIVVSYLGIKVSVLLCSLTVLKGKMAIVWFMILMQPQAIVYIFIICFLLRFFNRTGNDLNLNKKSLGKIILFVSSMTIIMCMLEAFVNPYLMNKIV